MVVNMFIVAEIFYLFNVRYLHTTSLTWRGAIGTPAVLIAITILVLGQALFTYAPFMHAIFHSRPLTVADLALLVIAGVALRSEEHTSELQSLMRISYAVFCLNKNKKTIKKNTT